MPTIKHQPSGWYRDLFVWPQRGIDGRWVWGTMMRRKLPDGRWEFRELNEVEQKQYLAERAW